MLIIQIIALRVETTLGQKLQGETFDEVTQNNSIKMSLTFVEMIRQMALKFLTERSTHIEILVKESFRPNN